MGMTAREPEGGGGDFEPIPKGVFQAICIGLWDLGTQNNPLFNKAAHKVMVMWEFPEHRITIEKDGEPAKEMPMVISKEYTLSLHKKANLRADLEGWREKEFTPEELAGFELKVLLGVNCMIQIFHKTKNEGSKDERTYANVKGIMKLMKGMQPAAPEHEPTMFDIDEGKPIPDFTPDWIADKIRASEEFQALNPQSSRGYPGSEENGSQPDYPDQNFPGDDDDIPF